MKGMAAFLNVYMFICSFGCFRILSKLSQFLPPLLSLPPCSPFSLSSLPLPHSPFPLPFCLPFSISLVSLAHCWAGLGFIQAKVWCRKSAQDLSSKTSAGHQYFPQIPNLCWGFSHHCLATAFCSLSLCGPSLPTLCHSNSPRRWLAKRAGNPRAALLG